MTGPGPCPRHILALEQPVDCVGWIVVTEIADRHGRVETKHGNIHPSHAAAQTSASVRRKLPIWIKSETRTVVPVCTAFPLSAVLAGEAMRLEDYQAALATGHSNKRIAA